MKRTYIITLLLSLCSLFTYAQDSFFDKFADMDGVTSVYISKAMLSLMPDMKTEGVNIGEVASKLDNIQILSCEKPDIIAKLKKETAFISPKNGYEELMRINDEGEKTIIYLKRNKNKEKEFVLMSQEKNEFTIIAITGNLTLQERRQRRRLSQRQQRRLSQRQHNRLWRKSSRGIYSTMSRSIRQHRVMRSLTDLSKRI